MNKKFFYLWFFSAGLFVIPMIFMCFFVYKSTIPRSIAIMVITAVIFAFFLYCNKKNMLPDGYTTIQALFFYLKCKTGQKDYFLVFHRLIIHFLEFFLYNRGRQ